MPEQYLDKNAGRFIPAFFVDIIEKGALFEKDEWPPHITMFPPIEEPFQPEFIKEMRARLNPIRPFVVTLGRNALFGANNDIPVIRIANSPELQLVHARLTKTIGNLLHDPTYRQPYNPHITHIPDREFNEGDEIEIAGFSIASKPAGEEWTVVDKVGFKG